jgi:hypothetical protein
VRCSVPLDDECEVVGTVQAQSHLSLWHASKTAAAFMAKREEVGSLVLFFFASISRDTVQGCCAVCGSYGIVVHHDSCKFLQDNAIISRLDMTHSSTISIAVMFCLTSKHDVVHQPGDAADGVTRVDNFLEQFLFGCLLNDLLSNEA